MIELCGNRRTNKPRSGLFSRHYITDPAIVKVLTVYGAFEEESNIGVLAIRHGGTYISLFFVDPDYHRQGVGTALMQRFLTDSGAETITVHSSPYAVEVYRRLGFQPTAAEQLSDVIRYIPMEYKRRNKK